MNKDNNDQDFDVFRYVAEEMTLGEEQSFEQRLADDQQLREKVTDMVCSMATVDNVFATAKVSPADSRRAAKLRVRRIVVSLAAMLLIGTLAIVLTPKSEMAESDTESVAIAWAEAVDSEEFELPEQEDDFEFATLDFESDDDWISEVIEVTGAAGNDTGLN